MKCRMILPVGLLSCLVCFGGANASAFELFRRLADESAVPEPPAIVDAPAVEGGKFEAAQKGCGPACQKGCEPFAFPARHHLFGCGRIACEPACGLPMKGEVACQKSRGPVCQKGCEPCDPCCRPRLWGRGHASCEPACGIPMKGEVACQKRCAPVCQKSRAPVCQKSCAPVCQKGCEPCGLGCHPRLWGRGHACCEPACGVPMCGDPCGLLCHPRLRGWGNACCEMPTCVETTVQKGCCSGAEQKGAEEVKDSEVQK